MQDLTISDGWFKKDKKEEIIMKKLCEHRINTTTLDYDIGIEYCNFCGALGHYSIDKDKVEWKLPDFLINQNYYVQKAKKQIITLYKTMNQSKLTI